MNDLELLRTIDPAEDTHDDDRAAEQLLRMVLASPRPTRRRRRRALIALPVAAALLAALALALDRGGESLAAKAYAATAPGEEIVHEVSEFAVGPSGRVVETQESWWRPADGTARWVMYVENKKRSEYVIGADGVARLQPPFASYPGDGDLNPHGSDSARKFVDGMRSVTLGFREEYAGQQLHDD